MGRPGTLGHGSGTGSGVNPGRGRASIGQPIATGGLDTATIRTYIRHNSSKIAYCYEKELLKRPGVRGIVNTQFFISKTGTVVDLRAVGVTNDLSACVAAVIKAIQFPKPTSKGGAVQVFYPFNFRPTDG